MKICVLVILVLAMNACTSVNQKEDQLPLATLHSAAEVQSSCMNLLKEQISKSLSGVALNAGSVGLMRDVFDGLPPAERTAIASAASQMRGRHYKNRERIDLLNEGFAKANICGTAQPDLDLPIFADQLNLYLVGRGINTDDLFSESEELATPELLLLLLLDQAN